MNFKTTFVLIGLLVVAGLVVLLTREGESDKADGAEATQQKVLDLQPEEVTKIVVTPADGAKTVFEKRDAKWRLVEPVSAAAETWQVDSLLRAVTDLESTSTASNTSATGLDKPQYVVELTTSDGRTRTINVGAKTAVGDSLYLARKDDAKVHVVSADLLERLKQSPSEYRDPKLVEMTEAQVKQLTINKPDGKIVLTRAGQDWKMVEPKAMPADENEVGRILSALQGLRAAEFVSDNLADASQYQLDRPRFSAILSGAAATTLPVGIAAPTTAATQPATQGAEVTIKFGRYDDVMKENIMVLSSQTPAIAKVGAHILETIDKTPLELRDRKVFQIDPEQVSEISISTNIAATTQPTTKPASQKQVSLKRRHEAVALGPAAPSTRPATGPATTQATTQAATAPATTAATTAAATQPVTKWEVVSGAEREPAADSRVDSLLASFNPLRATKYLESAPATQPTATHVVRITTQAAAGAPEKTHEIRIVDPGNAQPLVGTYNDLAFELDRFIVDRLTGDFERGAADATRDDEEEPHTPGPPIGLE